MHAQHWEWKSARQLLDGTASKTSENMGEQIVSPSPTAFLPDSVGRIWRTKLSLPSKPLAELFNGSASKTSENMGGEFHPPSPTAFLPDSVGRIQETRLINEDDLLAH
jgi:hypothetical protein